MGMAASQGRLLFMTARLSNIEFEQQCVAYSKQRLADDSQEANDEYLEALSATQYQVITGYSGDTPTYEPVTYNQLTGMGNVATGKQYIVSDNKGQIVVAQSIADSFKQAQGDYNKFLKLVGQTAEGGGKALTQVSETNVTEEDVHQAWDKYFASVNRSLTNGLYYENGLTSEHVLNFAFHDDKERDVTNSETGETIKNYSASYCTYDTAFILGNDKNKIYLAEDKDGNFSYDNYEIKAEAYTDDDGKTQYMAYIDAAGSLSEHISGIDDSNRIPLEGITVTYDNDNDTYKFNGEDALYVDQNYTVDKDGSISFNITKNSTSQPNSNDVITGETKTIFYNGTTEDQRQLYDYAAALTEKYATNDNSLTYDADKVQYYKNIYDQMTTKGYTTYQEMIDNKYINTQADEKTSFKNDEWLITLLKNGKLAISYYSSTEKEFIGTTLDDDESITEKENKSKMAIAEQAYNTHMDKIESEDKRLDMQLSRLESEHTALQTEYESVAKVISKNVEKSFGTFNA